MNIINDKSSVIHFPRKDYYSSVSKTLPIGIEIAHLIIENPMNNCTYAIHSVERIKSKDLFYINPHSGSVTTIQSLQKSITNKHLLTIIYHCPSLSQMTSTRLHINILDKDKSSKDFYRFNQDNYLIIFETSFIKNQKKYLMNFELINNQKKSSFFLLVKPFRVVLARVPIVNMEDIIGLYLYIDEKKPVQYFIPIDRNTQ